MSSMGCDEMRIGNEIQRSIYGAPTVGPQEARYQFCNNGRGEGREAETMKSQPKTEETTKWIRVIWVKEEDRTSEIKQASCK